MQIYVQSSNKDMKLISSDVLLMASLVTLNIFEELP